MGIIQSRILRRIGGYNLTRVIFELELSNSAFTICASTLADIFEQFRTGLVFVLRLNTILGFRYRAWIRPRTQTYKIRLENESRVGRYPALPKFGANTR